MLTINKGNTKGDLLPKGQEEQKTQGQVYFVDHNTKSTLQIKPDFREAVGALPGGQEKQKTKEG